MIGQEKAYEDDEEKGRPDLRERGEHAKVSNAREKEGKVRFESKLTDLGMDVTTFDPSKRIPRL